MFRGAVESALLVPEGVSCARCCSTSFSFSRFCTFAAAQFDDIIKKAGETLSHGSTSGLSDDKITAGLKQALQLSTGKAVSLTGRPDGFLKNQAIKILLPPKLQTIGKGMRMLGMGATVNELRSA